MKRRCITMMMVAREFTSPMLRGLSGLIDRSAINVMGTRSASVICAKLIKVIKEVDSAWNRGQKSILGRRNGIDVTIAAEYLPVQDGRAQYPQERRES